MMIIGQGRYFQPPFINGKPIAYPRDAATSQDPQLPQVRAGSGYSASKIQIPPTEPSMYITTEASGTTRPQ